jgi:catechol 2,3-dioxygenase-like lactoylglutathione lyase family enzyme
VFSHIMLGSSDIEKSKKFYDAVLGALGAPAGTQDAKGRLIYSHGGGRLMISKPNDGAPATGANGGTIGFSASSNEIADAWHKAGVENGGKSCEDPPGPRQGGSSQLYLAYLRDPDGNKLCVVHPM